jgi:hypothetical protein
MSSISFSILSSITQPLDDEDQFQTCLASKQYVEAAKLAEKLSSDQFAIKFLRDLTIAHFNNLPKATGEEQLLIDVLTLLDTEERAYGFNTDWIELDLPWFEVFFNSFLKNLSTKCDSHGIFQKRLFTSLAELLTWRNFSTAQACLFLKELPEFDPRQRCDPSSPFSNTPLQLVKQFDGQPDLIRHFESMSPERPKTEVDDDSIDTSAIAGVAELRGRSADPISKPTVGTFLKLDTLLKIYQCVGRNPAIEGEQSPFKFEIKRLAEKNNLTLSAAFEEVYNKCYQVEIQAYESVKTLIEQRQIEFYSTQDLSLGSISEEHHDVGLIAFKGQQMVYKQSSTLYKGSFVSLAATCDFVVKARKLRELVPNVVQFYPQLIINETEQALQLGYLMEVAPGKELRAFTHLSKNEKEAIQSQFDQSVRQMLTAGYVLYDFHEGNVMWDGKKLTFIDLSPSGFTAEAHKHADTEDVIYRLSQMLANKATD